MPASARAVYAPRENPRNETAIGEPSFLKISTIRTGRTKQANFVANFVVLHDELVTIHHMLIEVQSNSLIHARRTPINDRRNDARREVCSYSRLQTHVIRNIGNCKTGNTHLVVAQLVLNVIFRQKRIQLDHICNIAIVLVGCAIKTQYKRAGRLGRLVRSGGGFRRVCGHWHGRRGIEVKWII